MLPESWQHASVDQTFSVGDFDFRFEGDFSFTAAGIGVDAASICFTVPNGVGGAGDAPGIPGVVDNDYFFVDPVTLAPDPAIVDIGFVNPFSVRLRHHNRVGEVRVDNRVDFTVLGEVNAVGSVKVVDTQGQVYVEKILENAGPHAAVIGGVLQLAPGDTVTYRVRAAHVLGDNPVENIVVRDIVELHVPVSGGQFQPQGLQQTDSPVFTLQPGEQREFVFTVVVPSRVPVGSKIVNAACVGTECDSVETPIRIGSRHHAAEGALRRHAAGRASTESWRAPALPRDHHEYR